MATSYNQMLRAAHGRLALRSVDIPARTLGVDFWERQAPVAPLHKPRVPNPNPPAALIALQAQGTATPDYGFPGRGPTVPDVAALTGHPWYGPGVADL